ncbi:MAG TPA: protein-ADP-ribose hydrolase [Megamonas hypermegale]|uniref:Protein-ADP-ribose hydrolase n=1 Tax=Megamonas hypermegale TaxID=158847 RepID=A0A921L7R9_9FIRM|nr:protein-ADP-ribose hydrolase [Megamonas hypermegale]
MTQAEQLDFLIRELMPDINIPANTAAKWRLFRSLVNMRPAGSVSEKFLQVQDDFLQNEIKSKGITDADDLKPLNGKLCLWQGDITTLKIDAIVNAANSQLTGCYYPCHGCIDNAIHTFAGVQLRNKCAEIMQKQGFPEPTGQAKITPAYNLPSRYILHTVGPIIRGKLTAHDCEMLASCYRSCLELANAYGLQSIAFCCISTGEFHFPRRQAAEIAVKTVQDFLFQSVSVQKVVFNVFTDEDRKIYEKIISMYDK